jgi:hypothetical protein
MNNTDKEDEEGGKPTQSNGAVQAARVTGEHLEEEHSAEKVSLTLLFGFTTQRCCFYSSINRK